MERLAQLPMTQIGKRQPGDPRVHDGVISNCAPRYLLKSLGFAEFGLEHHA